jgi:hypothetical protein
VWPTTSSSAPLALKDIQKAQRRNPTWIDKQLKEKIPFLQWIGIRVIQRTCKKKLNMLSRKKAKKPLLTQRMKDLRLVFDIVQDWGIEEWGIVCSQMRFASSCNLVRCSPSAGG